MEDDQFRENDMSDEQFLVNQMKIAGFQESNDMDEDDPVLLREQANFDPSLPIQIGNQVDGGGDNQIDGSSNNQLDGQGGNQLNAQGGNQSIISSAHARISQPDKQAIIQNRNSGNIQDFGIDRGRGRNQLVRNGAPVRVIGQAANCAVGHGNNQTANRTASYVIDQANNQAAGRGINQAADYAPYREFDGDYPKFNRNENVGYLSHHQPLLRHDILNDNPHGSPYRIPQQGFRNHQQRLLTPVESARAHRLKSIIDKLEFELQRNRQLYKILYGQIPGGENHDAGCVILIFISDKIYHCFIIIILLILLIFTDIGKKNFSRRRTRI